MSRLSIAVLVTTSVWGIGAAAQAQLPTLDEARKISQRTGRPIFAMAGQET